MAKNKYEKPVAAKPIPAKSRVKAVAIAFVVGFSVAGVWSYAAYSALLHKKVVSSPNAIGGDPTSSWSSLDSGGIPVVDGSMDIALMNLACCPANPKSAEEIPAMLTKLDQWALEISTQTNRNFHRYQANPKEFGSEAEWKLGMMTTILGQDLGVKYDSEMSAAQVQTASNDEFFSKPAKVFLQGLLGAESTGTCASLPVLYVALGKRLGYPMHLVSAKRHLFARWDDGKGTRVNLECSNAGGFTSHPDEYYRTWPMPMSPEEEADGGYLKNLTAKEYLAVFLTTRTACLASRGDRPKAILSAAQASSLAPNLGDVQAALMSSVGYRQSPDPSAYASPPLHLPRADLPQEPSPYDRPNFPQANQYQPFNPNQPRR